MLVGAKKLAENSEPQLLQWLAAGQSIPDRSHADEHKSLLLGLLWTSQRHGVTAVDHGFLIVHSGVTLSPLTKVLPIHRPSSSLSAGVWPDRPGCEEPNSGRWGGGVGWWGCSPRLPRFPLLRDWMVAGAQGLQIELIHLLQLYISIFMTD